MAARTKLKTSWYFRHCWDPSWLALLWSALQHAVTVLAVLPAMASYELNRQLTTWQAPVGSKGPCRRQIDGSASRPTTHFDHVSSACASSSSSTNRCCRMRCPCLANLLTCCLR